MMHIQQDVTKPLCFGQQELPPPPEHVPEKFKAVWKTLPGCCRNFYLNPGAGCCAGQPEPKPKMMAQAANALPAIKQVDGVIASHCHREAAAPVGKQKQGWQMAVINWFKRFFTGFWQDLLYIFRRAPKQN